VGHAPRSLTWSAALALALALGAGCASKESMRAEADESSADRVLDDGPRGPRLESEAEEGRRPAPAPPDGDATERPRPLSNDPFTERPTTGGGPARPHRPVRVDLGSVSALERRQWPLLPADVRLGAAWIDGGRLADDGPALLDLEARLERESHVTAVLALRAPDDAPDGLIARTPELCAWARAQRLDLLLVGERDARRGDVVLLLHVAAAVPLELWVAGPPSGDVHDDLAARLASAGLAVLQR
jgi:hypothetical protein